ncbi:MAG: hypothetical protein HZA15_03325 [Nitrospirae bacterium]|nr:hypothetical protein [Nitrospirota bacterium]
MIILATFYLYISERHGNLPFALTVVGVVVLVKVLGFRNWGRPLFEIKDDILYVKTTWGLFIREYPLRNFGGKIEVKFLAGEYLVTPGFLWSGGQIDLNSLNETERKRFMDYLKENVERNTAQSARSDGE